ncbi:hypothetical protein SKAU_G00034100 [Synaphobranchus kaupii]|uniref:Uncharacterized protein n=1 Tax=Synaphobranchus kaupii TaxID=118154 RepID=A0A9Q1JGC3_SYNKA|nr:hypothetical protein SKAU_G00034100 [Synaphobranchus kaupii]
MRIAVDTKRSSRMNIQVLYEAVADGFLTAYEAQILGDKVQLNGHSFTRSTSERRQASQDEGVASVILRPLTGTTVSVPCQNRRSLTSLPDSHLAFAPRPHTAE